MTAPQEVLVPLVLQVPKEYKVLPVLLAQQELLVMMELLVLPVLLVLLVLRALLV